MSTLLGYSIYIIKSFRKKTNYQKLNCILFNQQLWGQYALEHTTVKYCFRCTFQKFEVTESFGKFPKWKKFKYILFVKSFNHFGLIWGIMDLIIGVYALDRTTIKKHFIVGRDSSGSYMNPKWLKIVWKSIYLNFRPFGLFPKPFLTLNNRKIQQ